MFSNPPQFAPSLTPGSVFLIHHNLAAQNKYSGYSNPCSCKFIDLITRELVIEQQPGNKPTNIFYFKHLVAVKFTNCHTNTSDDSTKFFRTLAAAGIITMPLEPLHEELVVIRKKYKGSVSDILHAEETFSFDEAYCRIYVDPFFNDYQSDRILSGLIKVNSKKTNMSYDGRIFLQPCCNVAFHTGASCAHSLD